MIGPFVALAAASSGLIASTIGAVLVAAAGAPEIAPWAQVGGTATAVGALAYVAKLLADGRLVAQPVAELIRKSDAREKAVEQHAADRERRLEELIADARADTDALRALLMMRAGGGHQA